MKNDKIKELKDNELANVTGGDVSSANIVGTVHPSRRSIREPLTESLLADAKPTADEIIEELRS